MKLRTQFFILVGGIIAVPFLVSAFMLLMQYGMQRRREPLPNYTEIMGWVSRHVPRTVTRNDPAELMQRRPHGLDILILNKENDVVYSTIAEIPPGTSAKSGLMWNYIAANIKQFHFQVDNSNTPGSGEPMVILKLPRIQLEDVHLRDAIIQVVMYTSVVLLVFSSLMGFFILRSLNGSIKSLEGATRRVAGGDLDFELPSRGNDQISSLTRSFDSMRRALKEEYARRARFIMGVSHDLRTPLTLIQGYVEAIADGYAGEPETQKKYLSIILNKTQNLEGMVGDLIEFVRMETGQWRMTHREIPARQFLMDLARRFAEDALILKRDFGWSIDLPDDARIRMDASLFTRALENLVGNAIRYTEERGKVALEARMEDGQILLSLSDTGIGIPQEELPRIYDPFYRGTNSRREQGFGLGLTTVKSIIESHGWSILVNSQVGVGTTFAIRIPVADGKDA
ncbi:MAG: HAMP domain-containing sensor histidine kinase [Spirochaetia bacterium]|jgi:signal transduction histidine kinase